MSDCSGLQDRTSLRLLASCPIQFFGLSDCSGLQDRTSLRRILHRDGPPDSLGLFRSPRPDFIETYNTLRLCSTSLQDCSGLQDRTSLRRFDPRFAQRHFTGDCSGLQDRTSLRRVDGCSGPGVAARLFRSPRPDFIETINMRGGCSRPPPIVPVSKTGLH